MWEKEQLGNYLRKCGKLKFLKVSVGQLSIIPVHEKAFLCVLFHYAIQGGFKF